MSNVTAHYLAIANSPYPSAADKAHAAVLLKRYNRMKRSRDKIKELVNERRTETVDAVAQPKQAQSGKTESSKNSRDSSAVRNLPRELG